MALPAEVIGGFFGLPSKLVSFFMVSYAYGGTNEVIMIPNYIASHSVRRIIPTPRHSEVACWSGFTKTWRLYSLLLLLRPYVPSNDLLAPCSLLSMFGIALQPY